MDGYNDRKVCNPLVSIVIPNYNYGKKIGKAIDSVLNQEYSNVELIIIDNASTDESVEIIKKKIHNVSNALLYINEKNIGIVGNFNKALEVCSGEFVTILSSDDFLEANFVKKCIDKFVEFPTAGMLVTEMNICDEQGNIRNNPTYYGESFFVKGIYQCRVFLMSNTFVNSQVMIRKKCLKHPMLAKGFNEFIDVGFDVEFWFRICLNYDFIYLKERLTNFQFHIGSAGKNYRELRGVMQDYMLHKHYMRLAEGNDYLKSYEEEMMRRSPLYCIRCIRELVISGEWKIAVKYLKFASIIAEDIVDTDYYVYCEKCIEEEFVDVELFDKYQKEYLESLKKGNGSRAPYPLPDNAQIIS